jgi:hypothetical protein
MLHLIFLGVMNLYLALSLNFIVILNVIRKSLLLKLYSLIFKKNTTKLPQRHLKRGHLTHVLFLKVPVYG